MSQSTIPTGPRLVDRIWVDLRPYAAHCWALAQAIEAANHGRPSTRNWCKNTHFHGKLGERLVALLTGWPYEPQVNRGQRNHSDGGVDLVAPDGQPINVRAGNAKYRTAFIAADPPSLAHPPAAIYQLAVIDLARLHGAIIGWTTAAALFAAPKRSGNPGTIPDRHMIHESGLTPGIYGLKIGASLADFVT